MTLSRRKMFGFLAAAPVVGAAVVAQAKTSPMSEWPKHIEYRAENGAFPWCVVRSGPNGERPMMAYRTLAEAQNETVDAGEIVRDVEDIDDYGFRVWADWARNAVARP